MLLTNCAKHLIGTSICTGPYTSCKSVRHYGVQVARTSMCYRAIKMMVLRRPLGLKQIPKGMKMGPQKLALVVVVPPHPTPHEAMHIYTL